MITVILGADRAAHADLFEQAERLRHRVFVEEMGWDDLRSSTGRERDRFDDAGSVNHFAIREGEVVGYQRLLSTTRPHLLSDVLPQLCDRDRPCGSHVREVSRYCVAPAWRAGRRVVGSVGSELIAAVVEWGLASGVTHALFQFEPIWIPRALQLQFTVRPLGLQQVVGSQQIIAAELGFDAGTLAAIREYRAHHEPILEYAGSLAKPALTALTS